MAVKGSLRTLLLMTVCMTSAASSSGTFIPGRGCGTTEEISTVESVGEDDDLDGMGCTIVEVRDRVIIVNLREKSGLDSCAFQISVLHEMFMFFVITFSEGRQVRSWSRYEEPTRFKVRSSPFPSYISWSPSARPSSPELSLKNIFSNAVNKIEVVLFV